MHIVSQSNLKQISTSMTLPMCVIVMWLEKLTVFFSLVMNLERSSVLLDVYM